MNRTELFFEKNGRNMAYIFLGLLVLAALIFGYRALIVAPRATKAAERIAEAQYRFEEQNPDYQLALEGDANGAGFLDVIEEYGSTPSGNLAKHYAGICYLKTGDLENAANIWRSIRRSRVSPERSSTPRIWACRATSPSSSRTTPRR